MNMKFRPMVFPRGLCACLTLMTLFISNKGISGTVQKSFKIKEKIINGCQIAQKQDIDFGILTIADFVGNPPVAVGNIEILCTPGVTMSVTLDGGKARSGTQRRMQTPENKSVAYDIFSDAAYTQLWSPEKSLSFPPAGSDPQTIQLYARLAQHGAVPEAGNYQDIVNVTVSY